jgi:hypothetical protein
MKATLNLVQKSSRGAIGIRLVPVPGLPPNDGPLPNDTLIYCLDAG